MIQQFLRGRSLPSAAAIVVSCLLVPIWPLQAQQSSRQADQVPTVTRAYAVENARIVTAPGQVIERGTVVLRNGLIEAVGRDVRAPYDAEIIAGDSLVVYAGFIDGLSHAGIPEPADQGDDQEVAEPGNPSSQRAGILPQRKASNMIDASDDSIVALRNAGFSVAHVVPHGRSLPGSGAIISLGGPDQHRSVLDADASLFMQFEGARGVYPSTDMAVMARIRQLYREAERRRDVERLYAENPTGMERPHYDEVYHSFYSVMDEEKPVVFYTAGTSGALQVHRALELQDLLGFPMILAGLNQSFEVIDVLRQENQPVILTLGFPELKKEEGDSTRAPSDSLKAVTPDAPDSHFISDHRTFTFADIESERENLRARQTQQQERYYRSAAELETAGFRFALSTKDVKGEDILKNLRRMVEHGLSEEAALAALTTNPASIFGLERRLGTIEAGKIGNLVITSGALFDESAEIRHVFVDGLRHDVASQQSQRAGRNSTTAIRP